VRINAMSRCEYPARSDNRATTKLRVFVALDRGRHQSDLPGIIDYGCINSSSNLLIPRVYTGVEAVDSILKWVLSVLLCITLFAKYQEKQGDRGIRSFSR
jgi:hypothetical protein